jgi:hypothetical protein
MSSLHGAHATGPIFSNKMDSFFFEEIQGENFFSHLLKWGRTWCNHQDLNPGGKLSSQWTYHYTMHPFANKMDSCYA